MSQAEQSPPESNKIPSLSKEKPKNRPETRDKITVNRRDSGLYMSNDYATRKFARMICREDNENLKNVPLQILKDLNKCHSSRKNEDHMKDLPDEFDQRKRAILKIKDEVKTSMNDFYVGDRRKFRHQKRPIDSKIFKSNLSASVRYKSNCGNDKNKERRVRELYQTNPLEILNKEQTDKMNEEMRNRCQRRTDRIKGIMSSKNIYGTFNIQPKNETYRDKIVNYNEEKLKMSIKEKRKVEPYFGKKSFLTCPMGGKGAMSYL